MSEKRFEVGYDDESNPLYVYDNQNDNTYNIPRIVDLLNEQQATNDYLEESNSRFQVQLGETLRLVDEQQATINKLQELVAELGATLLMNGFEIEINGKDLNELIKDE